jgi:protein-tyrosine-phosphatase
MRTRSHIMSHKVEPDRQFNVLFLCTGNSARSILAEATMNHLASEGRFRAYSAGSHPKGEVNPFALELLRQQHIPTAGLRSKNWDEFAGPGAPEMQFVFTVSVLARATDNGSLGRAGSCSRRRL